MTARCVESAIFTHCSAVMPVTVDSTNVSVADQQEIAYALSIGKTLWTLNCAERSYERIKA